MSLFFIIKIRSWESWEVEKLSKDNDKDKTNAAPLSFPALPASSFKFFNFPIGISRF